VRDLLSGIWASLILVLGPIAGLAGGRKLRAATPPRKIIYLSNAANLIVLGSVTAAIDLTCGHKALGLITLGSSPRVSEDGEDRNRTGPASLEAVAGDCAGIVVFAGLRDGRVDC
jgi:hypothetical protein